MKQSGRPQPHRFQIVSGHSKVRSTNISFYYVKVRCRRSNCSDNPGDLLLGERYEGRLNKERKLTTCFCQTQQQTVGDKARETRNKICFVTSHVSDESNPRSARV